MPSTTLPGTHYGDSWNKRTCPKHKRENGKNFHKKYPFSRGDICKIICVDYLNLRARQKDN